MRLWTPTFEHVKALAGPDCDAVIYTGADKDGVWFSCLNKHHTRGERLIVDEDFNVVRRERITRIIAYNNEPIRTIRLKRLRQPVAVGACPWTDLGGEG